MGVQETVEILQKTMREAAERRRAIRARLVEMQSEIETLELEIASLDEVLGACQRSIDSLLDVPKTPPESEHAVAVEAAPEDLPPSAHERRNLPPIVKDVQLKSDRFRDLKIPQAVTVVLREAGGPLHVHEIYNRLREDGFHFGGNHPLITLSVSISRSSRFRRIAPATFDLVIRDAGKVA